MEDYAMDFIIKRFFEVGRIIPNAVYANINIRFQGLPFSRKRESNNVRISVVLKKAKIYVQEKRIRTENIGDLFDRYLSLHKDLLDKRLQFAPIPNRNWRISTVERDCHGIS